VKCDLAQGGEKDCDGVHLDTNTTCKIGVIWSTPKAEMARRRK
jgi:hypothetical protein